MSKHIDYDAVALFTIPEPYKDALDSKGLLIHNRPDLFNMILSRLARKKDEVGVTILKPLGRIARTNSGKV